MSWTELFDRATVSDVDEGDVRDALVALRDEAADGEDADRGGTGPGDAPDPSPARVVADADVLAADLLVGGAAREALDHLRRHSWTTLVASDALLDDAETVVATLADADLAVAWRATVAEWREPAEHPPGDHPALASAYRGGAMHVLSFDEGLTSVAAGAGLRERVPVSVREPRAFAAVFDAARLYPEVVGGEYPGPDRDARW